MPHPYVSLNYVGYCVKNLNFKTVMGSQEILGSNSPIMCPNNYVAVSKDPSDCSSYTVLKDFRLKNNNKIIFAHLNISSIRNKFDMITDLVKGRIDILLISETKIDNTFPTSQFVIPGFSSPFRGHGRFP